MEPGGASQLADLSFLQELIELAADQVESYESRGWTCIPGVLPPDVADALRSAVLSAGVEAAEAYVRRSAIQFQDTPENRQSEAMRMNQHRVYADLRSVDSIFDVIAQSPRMTSLAKQLLGAAQIRYYRCSVLEKPPESAGGLSTGLHQDLPSLPFDRSGSLMIWIALGDISADMGALQFIDGSHRRFPMLGRLNGRPEAQERVRARIGEFQLSEPLSLRSGDATVHDDMVLHCAGTNRSSSSRTALTINLIHPDILFTGAPHHATNGLSLTVNASLDHPNFPIY